MLKLNYNKYKHAYMNNLINNFDLFIFDLDDTLVKSEKYHYTAWLITLKNAINDDFYFVYFYFVALYIK